MEARMATGMETILSERLRSAGVISEPVTVSKNGIELSGMRIVDPGMPNISPVVYYKDDENVDAVMKRIKAAMQQIPPRICVDHLTDPGYFIDWLHNNYP